MTPAQYQEPRNVAKANLAAEVLNHLRDIRDDEPGIWDDLMSSNMGPSTCDLWDRLKTIARDEDDDWSDSFND